MGMIWVAYRRPAASARRLLEDSQLREELLESDDDVTSVDIDKAWHGLHWLLTGNAFPDERALSQAIFGGDEVGEDLGYGPGRLVAPDTVVAIATALRGVEPDALAVRMDPAAMEGAELYPPIWDEPGLFEDYLAPAYRDLREFYQRAASAGEAVIQTLS